MALSHSESVLIEREREREREQALLTLTGLRLNHDQQHWTLYGTKSLHYIILEYPRPEVICLWPKEQEPGLHQRNRNTDIVILQETWYRGDGPTGCPLGYRELVVPSTKLPGVKQGRDSGGYANLV